jgi:FMN phosphatase YigB (HAD superfamily)
LNIGENKLTEVFIDLDSRWIDIEDIDFLLFELHQAQKQLLDDLGAFKVHLVSLTNDRSEADRKVGELEHDHTAVLEEIYETRYMLQCLL